MTGSLHSPPEGSVDVSAEFQRRRGETWQRVRLWAALLVGGFLAAIYADRHAEAPALFLAGFGCVLASILRIVAVVVKTYRCPSCDEVPMAGGGQVSATSVGVHQGVALNPTRCSHCNALLRHDRTDD